MTTKKQENKKFNPEKVLALDLLESGRGHFIISQALFMAIETMNERPKEGCGEGAVEREPSNLAHMKLLYKYVFSMYMPSNPIPFGQKITHDDIKESAIYAQNHWEDVMKGNFIKKDVDAVFTQAIERGVLSNKLGSKFFHGSYMYMMTDKNHIDYFKNKETKEYVYSSREEDKSKHPTNIINLDDVRKNND